MNLFASASRYWHTIRHLRMIQFYRRAHFRVAKPKPDLAPAPPLRATTGPWVAPVARRQSLTGAARFRFLNEERTLDHWDDPSIPKLWRYNLHYFDDLNSRNAEERRTWHEALLERWIAENPPARGSGWEPYACSLRIVNWIKYAMGGNQLPPAALFSLAVQVRWLESRIEWHLLGNHLFANAKALVFAGSFFAGAEAERWRRKGASILSGEIREQILRDGGHFERSPMYHALAIEDLLDLVNISRAFGFAEDGSAAGAGDQTPAWSRHIAKMRRWLGLMCHPDGEISFFNDAATGISPEPKELEEYASRLGYPPVETPPSGLTSLTESGYIRVDFFGAVAILDAAPLGPDYLPAHGHADTLSFELSIGRQRVLVNSGTSLYGSSPERLRQRGTAAHNTITVEGVDSSEVWHGFRVARRARVLDRVVEESGTTIAITASHDGYTRLRGKPVHQRRWIATERRFSIEDTIIGDHELATAHFHFHPDIAVEALGDAFRAALPDGGVVEISFNGGRAELSTGSWHPEFGLSIANTRLIVHVSGNALRTDIVW